MVSFCLKYALPWQNGKQDKIVHTMELIQVQILMKISHPLPQMPRKRHALTKPLFGSPSKKHAF